ncbi:hypothetical protein H6P81_001005 [Aristolochia fimbriata]|uniref:Uncharacterized protein n=1 Tax=Aristolochia fimbriata TaxID=158543 RepID=A0AAV7F9N6_ARIFI|nr:hypothetical protein H6P81_001005 [Aristolochia fimbriata]
MADQARGIEFGLRGLEAKGCCSVRGRKKRIKEENLDASNDSRGKSASPVYQTRLPVLTAKNRRARTIYEAVQNISIAKPPKVIPIMSTNSGPQFDGASVNSLPYRNQEEFMPILLPPWKRSLEMETGMSNGFWELAEILANNLHASIYGGSSASDLGRSSSPICAHLLCRTVRLAHMEN